MHNYSFCSSIAVYLQDFIDYKRALGYKYDNETYTLCRFDAYWKNNNGQNTEITRESLSGWLEKRPNEGDTSRSSRISVVRQFAIYMNGIGKESYVPMDKYKKDHPVVHILSSDEIQDLFRAMDEYKPKRCPAFSVRMRAEYKVIFRLIITTGLRRSEAVNIRMRDIDWSSNSIMIYDGKGNKDRLVYMSADMAELIKKYIDFLYGFVHEKTEWIFPSFNISEHVSDCALAAKFKFYWKLTRYAGTCEKDPTIHSLRHTFVVFRINSWIAQGLDTNLLLPYLSRQLGHKSPDETFYYYHQVNDSFKIIKAKDSLSSYVLPEVRIR